MRTKPIIEELQGALEFAAALDGLAGLAVQPGEAADVAAVGHAARRLSEKLGAIQRMITREVQTMRGQVPATAGKSDDDVVAMLVRAENARNEGVA